MPQRIDLHCPPVWQYQYAIIHRVLCGRITSRPARLSRPWSLFICSHDSAPLLTLWRWCLPADGSDYAAPAARITGSRRASARARERASARAVKLVLRQMNAAAGVGDPVLFFKAARAALQCHLAASWNVAPDRITAPDIEARLGASGADISHLFSLTDEASY